jgi:hypothetical protein
VHLKVCSISFWRNYLLIVLASRAEMLGLKPEIWESVKRIGNLQNVVLMMRNTLHLAMSFSPLIVLVPKKFSFDSIRRDHLLAVSFIFHMLIS